MHSSIGYFKLFPAFIINCIDFLLKQFQSIFLFTFIFVMGFLDHLSNLHPLASQSSPESRLFLASDFHCYFQIGILNTASDLLMY